MISLTWILTAFTTVIVVIIMTILLYLLGILKTSRTNEPFFCMLIYLATLCHHKIVDDILIRLGACQILISSLHSEGYHRVNSPLSAYVERYSCEAIAHLSVRPEARKSFFTSGVCFTLARLMKLHLSDLNTIRSCCVTLSFLCVESPNRLLEISDIGDILMASLIAHKIDLAVVKHASHTISMLASNSYAIRYKISEAGGCNLLVTALQHHRDNAEVSEHINKIISYIAGCGEAQRIEFLESGACEEVTGALRTHLQSSEVAASACSAIHFLAISQIAKQKFNEVDASSAIRGVIENHSGNFDVETHGNSALTRLWEEEQEEAEEAHHLMSRNYPASSKKR